jgi:hypothetical protein
MGALAVRNSIFQAYRKNILCGLLSAPTSIRPFCRDFVEFSAGYLLSAGGTLAGSGAGASVLYSATGTNNNTPFSTSYTIASLGPFSGGAFSGTAAGNAFAPAVNPFSLTLTTAVTASGVGVTTYSGNAHIASIPEPTSLLLLGTGLGRLCPDAFSQVKKPQVNSLQ